MCQRDATNSSSLQVATDELGQAQTTIKRTLHAIQSELVALRRLRARVATFHGRAMRTFNGRYMQRLHHTCCHEDCRCAM